MYSKYTRKKYEMEKIQRQNLQLENVSVILTAMTKELTISFLNTAVFEHLKF
jgi:hypothetical protein